VHKSQKFGHDKHDVPLLNNPILHESQIPKGLKTHPEIQIAHVVKLLQFWQFIPHGEQIVPLI
jgi:hypothetical protein